MVELVVNIGERADVNPERVRVLVYESGEVRCPGPGPGQAGGDVGDEVADLDAEVGEGAAGDGDVDGELGLAEDG